MNQIENYPIVSKGHAKDYSNQIIGDFLVLYRTTKPKDIKNDNHAYWLCQCQKCKNYAVICAVNLSRKTASCNCQNDLINQRFGRWIVLYKTNQRTKNRSVIWHCRCDCGNEKDVDAYTLTSGQSQSCGCRQKEIASSLGGKNKIDITGKRFGKLVALYPIYSSDSSKHTKWHCHCDCGNEVDIDLGNLRQGFSQSCGCTLSKQEEKIIQLLSHNHIPFIYQYSFKENPRYRFDFYVNNSYLIEYDGMQHFGYNGYGWNTKEKFNKTRNNDLLKNKYCFENNIPLIRIPFDKEYDLKDLLLETTKFLITPENEEQYYKQRMK